MGRRGRDAIWPGPTLLEQQSKGRKDITTLEASPEEWELWTPYQASQPWEIASGRWGDIISGFKTSGTCVYECWRSLYYLDFALQKRYRKTHLLSVLAERFTDIWSVWPRGRELLELFLGMENLVGASFLFVCGSPFTSLVLAGTISNSSSLTYWHHLPHPAFMGRPSTLSTWPSLPDLATALSHQ